MSAEIVRPCWLGKPGPLTKDRTQRHAHAFMNLEPLILEVERMSLIAARGVMGKLGDEADEESELAQFAVMHLHGMLVDLRKEYYRLWGERAE